MSLQLVTLTREQANAYVAKLHRHHKPPAGDKFRLGAWAPHGLCGAAIIGRPVAEAVDERRVAEITRVCTDGTRNACSFLYRAAREVARNLGYCVALTYTLTAESGASLRADGWWGELCRDRHDTFDSKGRPRPNSVDHGRKCRWVYLLAEWTPVVEDAPCEEPQLELLSL